MLRVVLPSLLEFVPWVLSWGADARVHGPAELREQVAESLRLAAKQYYDAASEGSVGPAQVDLPDAAFKHGSNPP
jgi:WYL domain